MMVVVMTFCVAVIELVVVMGSSLLVVDIVGLRAGWAHCTKTFGEQIAPMLAVDNWADSS